MAYTLAQLRGAWGAGKAAAEKEMQRHPLVGKFFHTNDDVQWQGVVKYELSAGRFIIQLFSWATGRATIKKTISINRMNDWSFYDNHADWIAAGDRILSAMIDKMSEQ